ncbi:hypothetical protein HS088_TW18G00854 [Tripterygium wilfordii]|uniref:Embryo defective n=2 Tax=Tripterygium wilfordii TaxID=458696 RepID=A0A7J7CDB9_TRIWF|nr:uncharacterized protein LOC119984095 isoform X2 [Tripterygium wilfordii]XP_038683800.1 uncharacterized protein LOC119984095 isoform X2 [Tripterygium wilfordii]XP_038683801.1 uncharacterized protein LOC119984095 isoform X2 [Tripterygium wilfordii]KAF5732164.1 hypothetical protein HS088_TW18G00854 [Tripterygium wilfordii]
MMSLVAHQLQGSCATFPSRTLSCSKEVKLKQCAVAIQIAGKRDGCFSLKHKSHTGVEAPCSCGSEVKAVRILAFKGNARNGDSGSRANGSRVPKNYAKLSYVPKETGESMVESPKVHNARVSYTSEANEAPAGSPAIHKLFKKWLTMLRTHSPSQTEDEILEGVPPSEISQSQNAPQNKGRSELLKASWQYFLRLDGTIKIPLLIFIPFLVAVYLIHGADLLKELTPLWVLGPLIVALYIKMFQALCALYVFTFRQTVKVIKNLPTYSSVAYSYVAQGKLNGYVRARFWDPLANIKKNHRALSRKKLEELKEWVVEMYLDFVESIWPYYCRTIRFLKRANLI